MNIKPFLFFVFLFILSSFCYAEPSMFYKVNSNVDLKIPCADNNDSICGSGTICNITINYPNNTNYVNNKLMTNNNVYFNYTLSNANTSGEYQTIVYCSNGVSNGYSFFTFKLNYSGDNEQPSAFLTIILLLPLLFAIVFMIGSLTMGTDHVALKIFLFLLSLCSYFISAYFGIISLVKFYVFPELNDALALSVVVIGFILFAVVCYFVMYIFQKAVHAVAQKKKEELEY
jgi:hypothetical protein